MKGVASPLLSRPYSRNAAPVDTRPVTPHLPGHIRKAVVSGYVTAPGATSPADRSRSTRHQRPNLAPLSGIADLLHL